MNNIFNTEELQFVEVIPTLPLTELNCEVKQLPKRLASPFDFVWRADAIKLERLKDFRAKREYIKNFKQARLDNMCMALICWQDGTLAYIFWKKFLPYLPDYAYVASYFQARIHREYNYLEHTNHG